MLHSQSHWNANNTWCSAEADECYTTHKNIHAQNCTYLIEQIELVLLYMFIKDFIIYQGLTITEEIMRVQKFSIYEIRYLKTSPLYKKSLSAAAD